MEKILKKRVRRKKNHQLNSNKNNNKIIKTMKKIHHQLADKNIILYYFNLFMIVKKFN